MVVVNEGKMVEVMVVTCWRGGRHVKFTRVWIVLAFNLDYVSAYLVSVMHVA